VPKPKKSSLIDAPAYTLREATRITGISFGALRAWTHGPSPIIRLAGDHLSFTNIVEAHTLRALRKSQGMRIEAVRNAVRYLERKLATARPLASRVFRSDGIELFVDRFGTLINASKEGRLAMLEVFDEHLRQVEYGHDGRARRLYLDADRCIIVIDPAVAFGRPVITGTRVSLEIIGARFQGGEEPAEIATDYEIPEAQVNQAIRTLISSRAA
jgi:uncharacterized protein (DUF433 family)